MYLLTCSLLDNNNLSGKLPDELAEMPSLKILYDLLFFMLCMCARIFVTCKIILFQIIIAISTYSFMKSKTFSLLLCFNIYIGCSFFFHNMYDFTMSCESLYVSSRSTNQENKRKRRHVATESQT